ncbi:3-dehydroquinate synthase II [Lentzea sp. NBRC 105346]|uniref:3-dehydroquinate synthase II family protein n=1 Tax=Lentzea sp. NBRC 105346 TaxID=3032205 RepID=UPI0024A0C26D|nr:3-dehydroquinate synthase II family protein [Lentzea sp. NBRC 105346]GLZ32252.1 3-dehydroquinate synthase II [Lentzea sp. NBRC 105346]
MKFGWIDLRGVAPQVRDAIVEAALHAKIEGVVDDNATALAALPPTVKRVLLPVAGSTVDSGAQDVVLTRLAQSDDLDRLRLDANGDVSSSAAFVEVIDDPTLKLACAAAIELPTTVVQFRDPTKIPLEIVIAAADKTPGQLICQANDLEEAGIILDVLEKGSDGVMLAPKDANDVFAFADLLRGSTKPLELSTLTVRSIEHNGLGDRVCVDTCTHFEKDEGILVGSYASGFVLCVSETHPLPYMPTRPFRVNAGALHSYTMGVENRTNYLSELKAGSAILAVGADGRTRRVVVGRVKLESRPLLTIRAVAENGTEVSLTVQDDWHVRVLGPGAAVLNVTELKAGDQLLGYLATDKRHVGWPVAEYCVEK